MRKVTSDFAFSTSVSVARLELWVPCISKCFTLGLGLEKMCVFNCAPVPFTVTDPVRLVVCSPSEHAVPHRSGVLNFSDTSS